MGLRVRRRRIFRKNNAVSHRHPICTQKPENIVPNWEKYHASAVEMMHFRVQEQFNDCLVPLPLPSLLQRSQKANVLLSWDPNLQLGDSRQTCSLEGWKLHGLAAQQGGPQFFFTKKSQKFTQILNIGN